MCTETHSVMLSLLENPKLEVLTLSSLLTKWMRYETSWGYRGFVWGVRGGLAILFKVGLGVFPL